MINNLNLDNVKLLIIDEISQVTPILLQVINKRLQQVKNNKLPFGGIPTILCGDFRQAPPIGGMSLTNTVVQVNDMINNNNLFPQVNDMINNDNLFPYKIISSADIILNYTKSVFF